MSNKGLIMTYKEALNEADKVGASKIQGLGHLAMTIKTLSLVHAINPELVYNGAVKEKLTGNKVRKLGPIELGRLMSV